MAVRSHSETIPPFPKLGQAMSKIEFEVPVPKLHTPGGGKDPGDGDGENQPRFVQDATVLSTPLIDAIRLYERRYL